MDFCLIAQSSFSWLSFSSWLAILQVVVGLGFIIFVHELGHFLVAKACGVKCDKFYVGFDAFDIKIGDVVLIPRRLFHFQWGETEYGIGIIPLGGYVKMLGQDDNPANQASERERTLVQQDEGGDAVDAESGDVDSGEMVTEEVDPRSYTAKTVPQRFAIISAGVIMNLIFAVIFAAVAYRLGVPYSPPVIGSTSPGGPAWKQDIRPGTRVLQINGDTKPSGHLRFRDVQQAIILTGAGHDVDLMCEVPGSASRVTYRLQPVEGIIVQRGTKLATIGISNATTNRLSSIKPVLKGQPASFAKPPLLPGDEVASVNGVPINTGEELKAFLATIPDQEAEFEVIREGDKGAVERISIKVPTQLRRTVGLSVKHAEVAAIQNGSPAAGAGFEEGDQLLRVDGEPIRDVTNLYYELLTAAREERAVEVTVARESGDEKSEEIELTITPRMPRELPDAGAAGHLPYAIDALGVAITMTPTIGFIEAGSPAEKAELEVGDRLVSAQFLRDGKPIDPDDEAAMLPSDTIEFAEMPQIWPYLLDALQFMGPEDELKLEVARGEETLTVSLKPVDVAGVYYPKRGFMLEPIEGIVKAESWGEAFGLGLRETKEDSQMVYTTLQRIVTGRVSAINLRGPGTIAATATFMAMEGLPTFLLFLTLISANLAVVNFLPIPVLDGGHAVFLIYEAIFRRPPPDHIVFILSIGGLVFILGLMVFVTGMDIYQWIIPW